MSNRDYALKHKYLGLCRSCPKPLADGSSIYCYYHREKDRIRGRIKDRISSAKLKEDCIEHYGGKCICCNESIFHFLTIDHEAGNGNSHRISLFKYNVGGTHMYRWLKKNNYPSGYSVLCMNCNWAKRYSKICPHKLRRDG